MNAIQNEDIEALTSLGLTVLQAKVYLALVESKSATIKDISKNAGVARQDLYRITSELKEYGLVEKIITKPITYKAIPLKNGVDVLLDEIRRKRSESHNKVAKLIQRYKNKEASGKQQREKNHFVYVPEKNALILKEKKMLSAAQKNVVFITSKKRFSQKLYAFSEEFKKAIENGVKIRIVTEKNEKHWTLSNKTAKNNKKNPSFEVRYLLNLPPVVMAVFDKKEAIIIASADAGLTESPALWSTNPSLVELAKNYFEIMWITAIESNEQALKNPQEITEALP